MPALLVVLAVLYPVLVYTGLSVAPPSLVAGGLLVLVIARLIFGKQLLKGKARWLLVAAVTGALGFSVLANNSLGIRFYPVVVSACFFLVFFTSLLYPPTVVERLARLQTPALSEKGVLYTRRVTQIWCLFFLVNAALSTGTALYASLEWWTLYNGLLSYLMMGVIAGVEWLVRQKVKAQHTSEEAK